MHSSIRCIEICMSKVIASVSVSDSDPGFHESQIPRAARTRTNPTVTRAKAPSEGTTLRTLFSLLSSLRAILRPLRPFAAVASWHRCVSRIFLAHDIGPSGELDSSIARGTTEYYCHSCLPRRNNAKPVHTYTYTDNAGATRKPRAGCVPLLF